VLGEVFAEGAADVGFWAICTKRSTISCAISTDTPTHQRVLTAKSPQGNELTFQVVGIGVELDLPFSALRQ
jgi:hypothetical protein